MMIIVFYRVENIVGKGEMLVNQMERIENECCTYDYLCLK